MKTCCVTPILQYACVLKHQAKNAFKTQREMHTLQMVHAKGHNTHLINRTHIDIVRYAIPKTNSIRFTVCCLHSCSPNFVTFVLQKQSPRSSVSFQRHIEKTLSEVSSLACKINKGEILAGLLYHRNTKAHLGRVLYKRWLHMSGCHFSFNLGCPFCLNGDLLRNHPTRRICQL